MLHSMSFFQYLGANAYTEVYEKVKHRRPRSTIVTADLQVNLPPGVNAINNNRDKNVRFSNGVAVGPEVVHIDDGRPHGSPSRWTSIRNSVQFSGKIRRARHGN